MFKTLQAKYPKDRDYPQRAFDVAMRRRVIDGTLYDCLNIAFHDEKTPNGEYVPLRDRRPCVRTALCRTVVDDSISLLFSEGHFPKIEHEDENTRDALARIAKESNLNEIMLAGATSGSVGSVCFLMRVLKGRVFYSVMATEYLSPEWNPDAPDTLLTVTEKYKVKGKSLRDAGYTVKDDELNVNFWYQRIWTDKQEQHFIPWTQDDELKKGFKPQLDKKRTVSHKLGFVPMVWVRNLPGGDDVDGSPTFPGEAIDTQIEIDYQLSQAGRGLKYSSDPTLLLKEPAMGQNGEIIKGAGNAIVVNADGDARMLEINGTAVAAVLEYVKHLREIAIEAMHGNRASAEKISAAQSGKAMELMNQALVWLADRLRISYGEGALLELLMMALKAAGMIRLVYKDGSKVGELMIAKPVTLLWPDWYAPTATDRQMDAATLSQLKDAGLMSVETAVKSIAADYDIEDIAKELATIKAEAPPPPTATETIQAKA